MDEKLRSGITEDGSREIADRKTSFRNRFSRMMGELKEVMGIAEMSGNKYVPRDEDCFWLGDTVLLACLTGMDISPVISEIQKRFDNSGLVVSCTTRSPRVKADGSMEKHGEDYFFVTKEEFELKADCGDFIENEFEKKEDHYAVPTAHVEYLRLLNRSPLIIKANAADTIGILKRGEEFTSILLLPSGMKELEKSLSERGEETPEQIREILKLASMEMNIAQEFDYVVLMDDFDRAVSKITTILAASEHLTERNQDLIEDVKNSFC